METDGHVQYLQDEAAPSALLTVTYPSNISVTLGGELLPSQVKEEPHVIWEAAADKFYTLIMVDPDAPSRDTPTLADIKHWLVVNIPGADVTKGDVLAPYIGSGPPQGSGLHRYIFLVFEQPAGRLDVSEEPRSPPLSRAHRINWSTREFRTKYGLARAFAGNYYRAQWEPYVDEFRKTFTE